MTVETGKEAKRKSWGRRIADFLSTVATGALAVGLVIVGTSFIAERATSIEIEEAAPIVEVYAAPAVMVPFYEVERSFVGQIEPQRRTDIAFELPGTVDAILVDEGDRVGEGDEIAHLDTRTLENQRTTLSAARQALEAQLELARLTMERQEVLEQRGHATRQVFDAARLRYAEIAARIAETDASIAGIDIQLDKAVIRAPFDGHIGARFVDDGASVGAAEPVVALLEDGEPLMRVGVAPDIADRLGIGDTINVVVSGEEFEGTVDSLRPDLDPTTRTRMILLRLKASENEAPVLFGQTGAIRLTQDVKERGAWVPVTALYEGVRGLWTVKTVVPGESGETTAGFEAIEILYADEDRAFVRGSFADGTEIIQTGPHRVTPGQRVRKTEG